MKLLSAIAVLAVGASAAYYPRTTGQDLCCAANVERAKVGKPAFKWSPKLDNAAQGHSLFMRGQGKIDHDEVPGTLTYDLAGRLKVAGFEFSTAGENIANGYTDLDATQKAWVASKGHYENIISDSFTVCGGGVSDPGQFYTVDFASPGDSADNASFYVLSCNGNTSAGANAPDSNALAHSPQSSAAVAATPASATVAKPAPTSPAAVAPPAQSVAVEESPAAVESPAAPEESPAPAPAPAPAAGKCKRMPVGSIAAGKCKPCKKCSANRRR